jgi:hypothetical protein
MVLVFAFMEGFGFGPGSLRRRKPGQREARHTPKHQPFLGLVFCRPTRRCAGADQRKAASVSHCDTPRHLANSSSLAFRMRRAASVSLRSWDCRANISALIPGFKYCCHFFNDTSFS